MDARLGDCRRGAGSKRRTGQSSRTSGFFRRVLSPFAVWPRGRRKSWRAPGWSTSGRSASGAATATYGVRATFRWLAGPLAGRAVAYFGIYDEVANDQQIAYCRVLRIRLHREVPSARNAGHDEYGIRDGSD